MRVLGKDHPDTLTSRHNLAYAYHAAGDLSRAIPLFEQALTGNVRVLGENHPPPDQDRARQPRCGAPATSVAPRTASVPAEGGPRAGA
jgi:hypothetical protein